MTILGNDSILFHKKLFRKVGDPMTEKEAKNIDPKFTEKSANEFARSIETGELYEELKGKKKPSEEDDNSKKNKS